MSERAKLDVPTARRYALNQLDLRGPDFVYRTNPSGSCRNVPFSQEEADVRHIPADDPRRVTGCLVGEILVAHGMGELLPLDPGGAIMTLALRHREWFEGEFPERVDTDKDMAAIPPVVGYLTIMQRWQDTGYTWGEAYNKAEEWLNLETDLKVHWLNQVPTKKWDLPA